MTEKFSLDHVEEILGPPDYKSDGIHLYNQDCLAAMRRLEGNFVDLTVTSPPYNIGKEYEKPLKLEKYVEWCAQWLTEIARLTSASGAFWLNLGYVTEEGVARAVPLPYLLWDRVPLFLMQEIVWHYGAGVAARTGFSPRNEKFLWYVKNEADYTFNLDDVRDPDVKYPNQKKNGKLKCNPLGKNPSDVWLFPKVTSGANRASPERTEHPAQFPVAVIERIIKACSKPGDMVLDPFMGSGTTALVAVQLGRPVLGFELSSRYLDIAIQRIEALFEENRIAEAQGVLFSGVDRQ
ncbi:MAG: site-specific DNA-methyltransferase [Terracidiphilus sp.]|nr:site-specific DNA-methyltransferase [Terracidiphilus sp.]